MVGKPTSSEKGWKDKNQTRIPRASAARSRLLEKHWTVAFLSEKL